MIEEECSMEPPPESPTTSETPGDELGGSPALPEAKPAMVPFDRLRRRETLEIIVRDENEFDDVVFPPPDDLNDIMFCLGRTKTETKVDRRQAFRRVGRVVFSKVELTETTEHSYGTAA
jgi:hypothetical protein